METRPDIEDNINAALQSAKSIQPQELPYGFSEKVVSKLHSQNRNNVRSIYTLSPLLRVAAVFILILINIVTVRLFMGSQTVQNTTQSQFITINEFVNEYQINDTNEELLTSNTPSHEQP